MSGKATEIWHSPGCEGDPDAIAVDPDLWRRIEDLLNAIAEGGTGWVISNKAIDLLIEIGSRDG